MGAREVAVGQRRARSRLVVDGRSCPGMRTACACQQTTDACDAGACVAGSTCTARCSHAWVAHTPKMRPVQRTGLRALAVQRKGYGTWKPKSTGHGDVVSVSVWPPHCASDSNSVTFAPDLRVHAMGPSGLGAGALLRTGRLGVGCTCLASSCMRAARPQILSNCRP